MPKQKVSEISKKNRLTSTQHEQLDSDQSDECMVPNPDYSGSDGDSAPSDDENSEWEISAPNVSYRSVFNSYTETQKKLESDHTFSWSNSEKVCSENVNDQIFLTDATKRKIASMSPVELFELFFSAGIKNYIIEASEENGLKLSMEELNTFVGILLLLSSFNKRGDQKEYWETDPLVGCSVVSSAMSRKRFSTIKSNIKYSKSTDKNDDDDKAWRVRKVLSLFRQNIQQFGFFSTTLSVDEMMVRFFGRTSLKQYLPSKPDRYGLKLWGLCGANGFLFNLDVYCGKNDASIGINLSTCALGSRVVLQMVNPLLSSLSKRKLSDYHIYFDNYFTSPDLVIHLNKCGLRSTETVRKNRVKEKHVFEKNAPRGSFKVSHDRNSGMNFISVINSKEIAILSTAAGVTPMTPMKSLTMEPYAVKRNGQLETQYSVSSSESSESDYASSPSSDLNDEIQGQNSTINDSAPNVMTFGRKSSFARRKASTCSNISSTNSTCLSLDGGDSESEINSTCQKFDLNGASVDTKRCDEIIDKIIGLSFTQKKFNIEVKETSVTNTNRTGVNGVTESTKNVSNGNNEGEIISNDTEIVKNFELDDINGNYEARKDEASKDNLFDDEPTNESEESDDDNDLVERGPVRPHNISQSHHEKPYYTLNWVASTGRNEDHNPFHMSDYDCVNEIVQDKSLYEKLNPYIDKLSKDTQFNQNYSNNGEKSSYNDFNAISGWSTPECSYADAGTPNSNISGEDAGNAQIPSIVLSDGESILEKLTSGAYQPAQSMCDTASSYHPSPGGVSSEHWPDSPPSSQHHVRASRSHSRASSRAQSPSSSINIGSPLLHHHVIGSPSQLHPNTDSFRVCQALSSSESSNHSFGDTSSPLSYEYGIDQKAEEQLGVDFDSFSTCYPNYMSSDTVVNTAEMIDAIVNNEIQRVEEARNGCEGKNELTKNVQIFRETQTPRDSYDLETYSLGQQFGNNLLSSDTNFRTQDKKGQTIDNIFDDVIASESRNKSKIPDTRLNLSALNTVQNQVYPAVEVAQQGNTRMMMNAASNNFVGPDFYGVSSDQFSQARNLLDFNSSIENLFTSDYDNSSTAIHNSRTIDDSLTPIVTADNLGRTQPIEISPTNECRDDYFHNTTRQLERKISGSPFNEFQIPETVSAFRQNHLRKNSERHIAPWPCLNLPETAASERLKAELDPRQVEKAMKDLLKRPPNELAAQDDDGDTMLMCLVGNPRELEKKKAYLVPLVERLSNINGALIKTNSRNQDALYMAAMYCPQMAYVTGYLAAVMLQRRIDISQRLYHGDTLVHVIAAKGDTHTSVLAELLALKTSQGNLVFDLSQRNYRGQAPLHVAVESHDPTGSGVNCNGVIRLLLQNGADQRIQQSEYGNTALHMAVSLCRDLSLIEVLLNNNGHEVVNMPNSMNDTPVHLAFALSNAIPINKQIQVCMNLIQAGGRTNVQNGRGEIPFALVLPERRETIRKIFSKNKNLDCDFTHR